ncbi:hypothetical protein KSD_12900 [Ktedonobacter sp. SOSP1-85]|nr:hypothetical protein KSD_12900 [Ktedonobacter sp. SOSP1-85]
MEEKYSPFHINILTDYTVLHRLWQTLVILPMATTFMHLQRIFIRVFKHLKSSQAKTQ